MIARYGSKMLPPAFGVPPVFCCPAGTKTEAPMSFGRPRSSSSVIANNPGEKARYSRKLRCGHKNQQPGLGPAVAFLRGLMRQNEVDNSKGLKLLRTSSG
jgi:hypothetical protein